MPAPRVLTEPLLTLSTVAARLSVSRDTVRRWVARGVKVDGRAVRLFAAKPGGSWRTDEASLAAFVAATTPGGAIATAARTPAARQRASEAAERELIAMGC